MFGDRECESARVQEMEEIRRTEFAVCLNLIEFVISLCVCQFVVTATHTGVIVFNIKPRCDSAMCIKLNFPNENSIHSSVQPYLC